MRLIRHWTSKNCLAWAKEYFQEKLTAISAQDGPNSISVKSVSQCEGDVDINQRKGKITTLFDVKLVLDIQGISIYIYTYIRDGFLHKSDIAGETKEDKDVTGTITVPEVAHDTEPDEYVVLLLAPPCFLTTHSSTSTSSRKQPPKPSCAPLSAPASSPNSAQPSPNSRKT